MMQILKKLTGANLSGWKQWLVQAAVILIVFAIGGLLVAASGIVPIKASAGHWAITEWFLQFSKRRSVDTHTKTIPVPPLDDAGLVLRGAGHYHIGCFPCHGSPEHKQPHVAQFMLPPPPYLGARVPEWDPEELFYIVKHGIKLTGMPAWPARDRDDEVWAMVAFLQKFPELDAAEYRHLALGESVAEETAPLLELTSPDITSAKVIETCKACHGIHGRGRGAGAFPILAGQSQDYLAASLEAYLAGERHSGIMQAAVGRLTSQEIQSIARYFSQLEPAAADVSETKLNASAIEAGKKIAREGIPKDRVPACSHCHGPGHRPNSHYPILAGQPAKYLALQLELFQKNHRGGTRFSHLMNHVAKQLTKEQIQSVTSYYESLTPHSKTP